MTGRPSTTATLGLTALAMLAFAANSILCRLALGEGTIDAASFGTIRVVSGAVVLALIVMWRTGRHPARYGDWRSALMLFAYVALFSFAYLSLDAGTGALILFGAVQLTMFAVALYRGERFSPIAWAGLTLAIGGLVYLVSPGLTAPPPGAALLMAGAGVAWGVYSLLGRGVPDPLGATGGNFLRAVPLVLAVSVIFAGEFHASPVGFGLAVASGAVTSGLGYVIWYAALRGLEASSAATVQLSVPAIAALGGVLLLDEALTLRLVAASVATLGGIAIVLTRRRA